MKLLRSLSQGLKHPWDGHHGHDDHGHGEEHH
jgi:hypothetical protein